jgi:hypothetical protein
MAQASITSSWWLVKEVISHGPTTTQPATHRHHPATTVDNRIVVDRTYVVCGPPIRMPLLLIDQTGFRSLPRLSARCLSRRDEEAARDSDLCKSAGKHHASGSPGCREAPNHHRPPPSAANPGLGGFIPLVLRAVAVADLDPHEPPRLWLSCSTLPPQLITIGYTQPPLDHFPNPDERGDMNAERTDDAADGSSFCSRLKRGGLIWDAFARDIDFVEVDVCI